ncbi:MAG: P1 family peptidase [Candidatus Riflebacteria bacterium]|nr:P1 family peptidase [Candidatus Riflebacteria bacterium]
MRITIAYNLRLDNSEETAELLTKDDIDRITATISSLKHTVTPVEVSGKPNEVIDRLLASEPDLIFNLAEGTIGSSREAFYPGIYEQLNIPFTGGNASLLHMNLDKHLAKTVLASRGIRVPRGIHISQEHYELPVELRFPWMIKPNSEGSSKGISQNSVVENVDQAKKIIVSLLKKYPQGLVVEEFIPGKELSVPFLESFPGKLLSIVEHTFDLEKLGAKYNIYDYDMKQGGESAKAVGIVCPADLSSEQTEIVYQMARQVFEVMPCPDMGRVDIRLHENGDPYFIELNPLPSLHPAASLMAAARTKNLEPKDLYKLIIRSAARRYNLQIRPTRKGAAKFAVSQLPRPSAREVGIRIGRFRPGVHNAITDVKGVKVGHSSTFANNVPISGTTEKGAVCTGITAVLPGGQTFNKRVMAGGFILNGVGEMSGLTQVLELGWLETPILLTNSHSVGPVHTGIIQHMTKTVPGLGLSTDVVLPLVGEADDSYLNDVRVGINGVKSALAAIEAAKSGPVEQGSVGGGTGMMSFDFAGGIGTSSRVLEIEEGIFTIGVLVMSNMGHIDNLTIAGKVVGKYLEPEFRSFEKRTKSEGSIIVVVATDVPLLSSQLNRIAKRAALGLGRTGSIAASTSGEIVIAFSTANRTLRPSMQKDKFLNLKCISDAHINPIYEATIEATEEAVLNAIFCSNGMTGRSDRFCPALPVDLVLESLRKGVTINESHR